MDTITRPAAAHVRELFQQPGPVTSLYLGAGPAAPGEQELRRRALVAQLVRQGADERTVRSLLGRLDAAAPARCATALFGAAGEVVGAFELNCPTVPEVAVHGDLPYVLPLLQRLQEQPAHVVAVLDRAGADIWSRPAGTGETRVRVIDGPDDEIVRSAPGGTSQMRYQHRAEDSWEHNAGFAAEQIARALADLDARVLILSGDVRTLGYLAEHLPAWVRREVWTRHLNGGRSADGSERARAEQVAQAVRDALEEETERMLARLAEERRPGGSAAEGVPATFEALRLGRVRTLLVTHDPADGRTAWYGPAPTDIADEHERGPLLGQLEGVRHGRLADVAVRSAVLGGAEVRVLSPGRAAAPADGIGALCRFA